MKIVAGSWASVLLRAAIIFVVSSFALWFLYNHYDVARDPKTSVMIASVVAFYDKYIRPRFSISGDPDAEYWRSQFEEQRKRREAVELEYRQYRLDHS